MVFRESTCVLRVALGPGSESESAQGNEIFRAQIGGVQVYYWVRPCPLKNKMCEWIILHRMRRESCVLHP